MPSDIAFDVPPSMDFAVDPSPDPSADVAPEATFDAFSDLPPRKGAKSRAYTSKPPIAAPAPPPARNEGAVSVCLSCGAAPPDGGDCPHDEVAHLADAPATVMAVVRRLQAAVQERHAQERALRRLVAAEVSSGNGDIETPLRATAAASSPLSQREPGLCTRCGHRPVASRATRRKALAEAQETFSFAAPQQVPDARDRDDRESHPRTSLVECSVPCLGNGNLDPDPAPDAVL